MSTALRPEEKAAALVVAVGSSAASGMLDHLSDDEVEILATEVAKIGQLRPETIDQVFQEVYDSAQSDEVFAAGGVDYARDMLNQWSSANGPEMIERMMSDLESAPFGFVRQIEPEQLGEALGGEHPQTVAVILAHQPAAYAATVLTAFEESFQAEVAVRVGKMGRISSAVIKSIEGVLKGRLGPVNTDEGILRGGVKELANVLNNSDKETERAVLERLRDMDQELADEVRALMFVFDDLVTLDDRSIQRILQDVNAQELAMALKGANDELSDTIMRNMSSRAKEALLEEIDLLGPARRTDVETARTKVIAAVRLLEEMGEIVLSRGEENELIE
ncbi:MAG: flagellar motor switch protein FliG [bacterium]|nr:flagellar motor switch protein FliG [bacterium]MCP4966791.1 flagellar motor switch protein FliG [bacterium]